MAPSSSSRRASASAGEKRTSSVSGLKERPSSAMRLSSRFQRASLHLVDRGVDRLVVDPPDLAQQGEVVAETSGEALERLEILREAVAAVAEAGVEERSSDPWIAAHHVGDGRHVALRPARTGVRARSRTRSSARGRRCTRAWRARPSRCPSR